MVITPVECHLSPPSTTSRLSDSDTSECDITDCDVSREQRRTADGASLSSRGSSSRWIYLFFTTLKRSPQSLYFFSLICLYLSTFNVQYCICIDYTNENRNNYRVGVPWRRRAVLVLKRFCSRVIHSKIYYTIVRRSYNIHITQRRKVSKRKFLYVSWDLAFWRPPLQNMCCARSSVNLFSLHDHGASYQSVGLEPLYYRYHYNGYPQGIYEFSLSRVLIIIYVRRSIFNAARELFVIICSRLSCSIIHLADRKRIEFYCEKIRSFRQLNFLPKAIIRNS